MLTPSEVDDLFVVLDNLRSNGKSIVIITHKLRETKAIADRVMVLRDGHLIRDDVDPKAASFSELSEMMVGRQMELGKISRTVHTGDPIFSVEGLNLTDNGRSILKNISFEVKAGEIRGVAGIEGNGQSELLSCITGLRKPDSMKLKIHGKPVTGNPADFLRKGMAHIPEDRYSMGLVASMSLSDNMILGYDDTPAYSQHGFLKNKEILADANALKEDFLIKAPDVQTPVSALSGGNAQKVVVARALSKKPDVLVVAQPTRGVDIGASEYIRDRIRALRDDGAAVLLISADLDEVMQLSDRIAVLYEGEFVYETKCDTLSDVEIGLLMTGGSIEEIKAGEKQL